MPELTIGLPVYNGADSIERALMSLLAQSHRDFILIVSDNASTDGTEQIVKRVATKDGRIRLVKQSSNIGAAANFMSLAMQANTPYFMWAAADDFWSTNYVEASIRVLRDDARAGFASGNFVNVDDAGTTLRQIQNFTKLNVNSATGRLLRYTAMIEASGKANPIYSVFRTPLIQVICKNGVVTFGEWGGDMAIIAAALARASYRQDTSATLFKQVSSSQDLQTIVDIKQRGYSSLQFGGAFPPQLLQEFTQTMTRGLVDPQQKWVVSATLRFRCVAIFGWKIKQKLRNLKVRLSNLGKRGGP